MIGSEGVGKCNSNGLLLLRNLIVLVYSNSDALKNSFFPRTIPLWNSLPSSVVSSKTIEEFKGLI